MGLGTKLDEMSGVELAANHKREIDDFRMETFFGTGDLDANVLKGVERNNTCVTDGDKAYDGSNDDQREH